MVECNIEIAGSFDKDNCVRTYHRKMVVVPQTPQPINDSGSISRILIKTQSGR